MGRTKMSEKLLFLDFDGVICDSVDECFASSWLAYAEYLGHKPRLVDLSDYTLFKQYRPLIRRGADYLLLQYCIGNKILLSDQSDFDEQAKLLGDEEMDALHTRFYAARSKLLEESRHYWLNLHRIYPGMYETLAAVQDTAWILTTKEVSFVDEILKSKGLNWKEGRIICSGKRRKLEVIGELLQHAQDAVFIDDQIDHFFGDSGGRVSCFLAAWGYVQPEWLKKDVTVLTIRDFVELIRKEFF